VTAESTENQQAAAAQAADEVAEARHMADARAQHEVSGSAVVVENASTPDDVAVAWPGSGPSGQAIVRPSEPPEVNKRGPHGPPDAA
jgi:hypothetical protein